MIRAIATSLAFVLLSIGSAHAADPFFDGLAGSWQGKGFVRMAANSPEEAIRCKISTFAHPGGNELTVGGTCVVGSFMLPVDGSIVAKGGSNYTSTMFRTLAQLTTSSFSGQRKGSRLYLRFKGRDNTTKQVISSTLTIRKHSKGRFDIAIQSTDPQTGGQFSVGVIDFRGG